MQKCFGIQIIVEMENFTTKETRERKEYFILFQSNNFQTLFNDIKDFRNNVDFL